MADAYKEKAKTLAHLQKVYTQLKTQVLAGQVASAASDDAEATLQSATGDRFIDRFTGGNGVQSRLPLDRNGLRVESRQKSNGSHESGDGWRGGQPVGNQGNSGRLFSARMDYLLYLQLWLTMLQTMHQALPHRSIAPVSAT